MRFDARTLACAALDLDKDMEITEEPPFIDTSYDCQGGNITVGNELFRTTEIHTLPPLLSFAHLPSPSLHGPRNSAPYAGGHRAEHALAKGAGADAGAGADGDTGVDTSAARRSRRRRGH